MSIGSLMHVWWNSDSSGNDRLVLLAIADEADDTGRNASPSVRRIAQKVNCHTATVMRSIEHLEGAGELSVVRPEPRGRGRMNSYRLNIEPIPTPSEIRSRYRRDHAESTEAVDNNGRSLPPFTPDFDERTRAFEREMVAPVRADPKTLIDLEGRARVCAVDCPVCEGLRKVIGDDNVLHPCSACLPEAETGPLHEASPAEPYVDSAMLAAGERVET